MPVTATIGVYDFDAVTFSKTLLAAGVDLLVDVRQRRGVRGSQYAWANSLRLQGLLAGAGIAYSHHRELAPTTELRHLQYRADDRTGVGKRTRELLAPRGAAMRRERARRLPPFADHRPARRTPRLQRHPPEAAGDLTSLGRRRPLTRTQRLANSLTKSPLGAPSPVMLSKPGAVDSATSCVVQVPLSVQNISWPW